MGKDLQRLIEENELGFFSLWCTRIETNYAVVLVNTEFREDPIYNHVAQVHCSEDELQDAVDECLDIFKNYDVPPCFYTSNAPRTLEDVLLARGMREHHTMNIALLEEAKRRGDDALVIRLVDSSLLDSWVETFARSFDVEDWLPTLRRLAPQLYHAEGVRLYLAELGEEPVATSALYRQGEMTGIYCVGSVAGFRGRGIASRMLSHVAKVAISEGCKDVCLQYDRSDHLTRFYERNGFTTIYTRKIMMFSTRPA